MRIHHLQHVPFEGLGSMEGYFQRKGHTLSQTRLYRGDPLPQLDDVDWLVVMGGPMGVHDESECPWMLPEKEFIRAAIDGGKIVLGICLGAQFIADVLGATVRPGEHREIGWFPLEVSPRVAGRVLEGVLPPGIDVFHWHGDTFDLPEGSVPLASTEATRNQGFLLGDRVVGLQFHLETTPASARALIENCRDELDGSRYVQTEHEMLSDDRRFLRINEVMGNLAERLETVYLG